jgi:N12 class adenine-specific DNA methylase
MTKQLLTPYQSQYYAWLLTRRAAGDSVESLAGTLVDSQVDLNPHQVEAALFACKNPLSRGVILADEVGLGKTIEAGLVISQRWAERRCKILIVVPANLRKQWHQELQDKFGLHGTILEAKSYNVLRKQGHPCRAGRTFQGTRHGDDRYRSWRRRDQPPVLFPCHQLRLAVEPTAH